MNFNIEKYQKLENPISKMVKYLCRALAKGEITKVTFKKNIRKILDKYENLQPVYQDIGLAVQKWSKKFNINEEAWKLAESVEPRIREAFNHWKETTWTS